MTDTDIPIIAVDLDDVLSQTNQAVADWHNATYGTNMTLDDFHYYHYWKNPYWGTPLETHAKVTEWYKKCMMDPKPVPGALEGVVALRTLGYKLCIVTARHEKEQNETDRWLNKYFPNLIDKVVCTGQFLKDEENGEKLHVKIGKAEVCHRLGAKLLIDDSLENVVSCAKADPPIQCVLFGDYQWNKRESRLERPEDHLGYNARLEFEHGREWWKDEVAEVPEGVTRLFDWPSVVQFVKNRGFEEKESA